MHSNSRLGLKQKANVDLRRTQKYAEAKPSQGAEVQQDVLKSSWLQEEEL